MKKLLIIPIVLIMFSCGRENPQRVAQREYHKELYDTNIHIDNMEFEDIMDPQLGKGYAGFVTFIVRHRTAYGYTAPLMYRYDEDERKYKFVFVLRYNPKEWKNQHSVDRTRFFPDGKPNQPQVIYTGK